MLALSVHAYVADEHIVNLLTQTSQKLARLIQQEPRVILVLGTTDYTHAGPFYGELPPPCVVSPNTDSGNNQLAEYIRSKDRPFLNVLCASHLPSAMQVWNTGHQISMCGLGATLLSLEVARNLGRSNARLLHFAVGSDISERCLQDETGFASVVFE